MPIKILKSETWDLFSFQIIVLFITYLIFTLNITKNIENFQYSWEKLYSENDSKQYVRIDSYSSRKSFSDNYDLEIYQNENYISSINCSGVKFKKYCKDKYDENIKLPITNLTYEKGISPSNRKIIYRIYSFTIIENNGQKKITNLSPTFSPNKHSSYLFIGISILLLLLAHLWIIRTWLTTRLTNFPNAIALEYLLIKIGLPISTLLGFIFFLEEVKTYYQQFFLLNNNLIT